MFFRMNKLEKLNTTTLKYSDHLFENADVFMNLGIAAKVRDKVYFIAGHYIQVYGICLNKIDQIQRQYIDRWSSYSNIKIYQDSIFLYDRGYGRVRTLDTSLLLLDKKTRPLEHYAKNFNRRYIYSPVHAQNKLQIYDIKMKSVSTVDLGSEVMPSVCILPSGEVFLVRSEGDECLIYNPATKAFNILSGMNIPRRYAGLVYCDGYIYAFGGYVTAETKFAERYCLKKGYWIKLRDMNDSRRKPACVTIERTIYIFCGNIRSIEMYDTQHYTYTLASFKLECYNVVAGVIDDRIYLIYDDQYKVMDKDLEIIQQGTLNYCYSHEFLSRGNVVVRNLGIYFNNSTNDWIEFANTKELIGGIEIFTTLDYIN